MDEKYRDALIWQLIASEPEYLRRRKVVAGQLPLPPGQTMEWYQAAVAHDESLFANWLKMLETEGKMTPEEIRLAIEARRAEVLSEMEAEKDSQIAEREREIVHPEARNEDIQTTSAAIAEIQAEKAHITDAVSKPTIFAQMLTRE